MHSEIQRTQNLLLDDFRQQRSYLQSKPSQYLFDLLHECESLRSHAVFSIRTASEINRAACTVILEERQPK